MSRLAKVLFIQVGLLMLTSLTKVTTDKSFVIDYKNNRFLKDGSTFQYISGSMHYFRVPKIYWQNRFEMMLAAGLNTVQTYVEWSQHEPYPGQYNFNDNLDLVSYIELAQKMGLLVILRPGPYIDAERDMGGFPFWLLQENPNILLRSSDKTYLYYMDKWFDKLLPMIKPLLYVNGGPVIAIQVENEYGSHFTCDFGYMVHLRELFRSYLGDDIVLFTTDGNADSYLKCGKTQGLYATVDFGPGANVNDSFTAQRNHEPNGPHVNSEYYPGWLDHWAYPHQLPDLGATIKTLEEVLAMNASINMYMFHGGTNFGFTNGAFIYDTFVPSHTSYDSGAPLTEAGDVTDRLISIRNAIVKFTGQNPPPIPPPIPKYKYGTVELHPLGSLLDLKYLLGSSSYINSKYPLMFEELGQAYGFVLYETIVTGIKMDPALLQASGIKDRGYVYIDGVLVGILSRQESIFSLPVTVLHGQRLSILVENQGRVCYGSGINDFKGLTSNVTIDGSILTDWMITPLPLNNTQSLLNIAKTLYNTNKHAKAMLTDPKGHYVGGGMFAGTFTTPEGTIFPMDTFIKMEGWYKGVIFINDFNLGRYWPIVGPQVTLYIPKSLIKPYPQKNWIIMIELEKSPCTDSSVQIKSTDGNCSVDLIDVPIINAPTPHDDQAAFGKPNYFWHKRGL